MIRSSMGSAAMSLADLTRHWRRSKSQAKQKNAARLVRLLISRVISDVKGVLTYVLLSIVMAGAVVGVSL